MLATIKRLQVESEQQNALLEEQKEGFEAEKKIWESKVRSKSYPHTVEGRSLVGLQEAFLTAQLAERQAEVKNKDERVCSLAQPVLAACAHIHHRSGLYRTSLITNSLNFTNRWINAGPLKAIVRQILFASKMRRIPTSKSWTHVQLVLIASPLVEPRTCVNFPSYRSKTIATVPISLGAFFAKHWAVASNPHE